MMPPAVLKLSVLVLSALALCYLSLYDEADREQQSYCSSDSEGNVRAVQEFLAGIYLCRDIRHGRASEHIYETASGKLLVLAEMGMELPCANAGKCEYQ